MSATLTNTDFHFEGQKSVYHGKVRDVYDIDNNLLVMVATDRISAFDVILPEGIPYKGQVLNQIAATFLDATSDIVPNWKVAVPDPMVTIGKKCEPLKIEMIVRGYPIKTGVLLFSSFLTTKKALTSLPKRNWIIFCLIKSTRICILMQIHLT